jgi:hypothetical protein
LVRTDLRHDDPRRTLESVSPLTLAWVAIEALVSVRAVAQGEHLLRAGDVYWLPVLMKARGNSWAQSRVYGCGVGVS